MIDSASRSRAVHLLRIADCGLRVTAGNSPLRAPRPTGRNVQVRAVARAVVLVIVLVFSGSPLRAQEIDRLLAAVNGKVVTEGDLVLARNLNAILSLGKNDEPPPRKVEIERLVDLELMRQELASFPTTSGDQGSAQKRIEELRSAYAEIGGLPGILHRLGLQESELLDYVRLQDSILRFVDFRFRAFASASEQEIQQYYNEKLVPSLRQANTPVPPLAEISGKIAEILKEEKVNVLMNQWIQEIRRHSHIEYFLEDAESLWGKGQ
ncbi:MAG TPA: hypothetical protein VE398_19595 [Acidobacteriota bacterium]|nr:hypothetical protein [Acidobacteriota bacterium]